MIGVVLNEEWLVNQSHREVLEALSEARHVQKTPKTLMPHRSRALVKILETASILAESAALGRKKSRIHPSFQQLIASVTQI